MSFHVSSSAVWPEPLWFCREDLFDLNWQLAKYVGGVAIDSTTGRIAYPAEDGSTVEVEYTNLTMKEAQALADQRPPRLESRILLTVTSDVA